MRLGAWLCRALAAAVWLTACERTPLIAESVRARGDPITSGTVDTGDAAVVALVRDGPPFCSGTVIGPRVVVTAAHCIRLQPVAVFFGTALEDGGVFIPVIASRSHPSFDIVSLSKDVGVLLLDAPAPTTPWPLLTTPLEPSFVGSRARIAGFGQTRDAAPTPPRKRQGTALLESYDADVFKVRPSPSLTCQGDSGGPAFLVVDDVEYLAGVSSRGDVACDHSATEIRIDAVAREFLTPFLAETAERARQVGERCFYDANCASGACVWPVDAPSFGYCSATCRGSADCPTEMACLSSEEARECRYLHPSPGALGASCASHSDCESRLCARGGADSTRRCATLCFPGDVCPAGHHCAPDVDRGDSFACFADRAPGCSSASAAGFDLSSISAAAALLWLLRRAPITNDAKGGTKC